MTKEKHKININKININTSNKFSQTMVLDKDTFNVITELNESVEVQKGYYLLTIYCEAISKENNKTLTIHLLQVDDISIIHLPDDDNKLQPHNDVSFKTIFSFRLFIHNDSVGNIKNIISKLFNNESIQLNLLEKLSPDTEPVMNIKEHLINLILDKISSLT